MDAEAQSSRYSAFISYNHRDLRFARKLQGAIESYRLPRAIRSADRGEAGRDRLKPCFRDRDELTASPDLSRAVQVAIGQSDHLIVICTPNAAASEWVGREIALFRALHPDRAILAALFEGSSAAAFHPMLVQEHFDGTISRPLAADFRPGGDGWRLALLKLVAVLAGVGLDALVQRDAQRRLRRIVVIGIGAGLILAVVVAITVLALVARSETRREQARGIATVSQLVDQRAEFLRAGRLDLLRAHDRAALRYFERQDVAAMPRDARLLSAKLLHGIAEDEETAGDLPAMKQAATTAWRTTGALLAADPDDAETILAHGQSEYWVGFAGWRAGGMSDAQGHFAAYAAMANRLVTKAPRNAAWQREAGYAESNLAAFLLRRTGDASRAGPLFRSAQRRFATAAALDPRDGDARSDLADGHGWLADVARFGGDLPAARAHRETQRALLLAMQRRDPDDAQIASSLIRNTLGRARIAAAQGRWDEAIAGFEQGRAAARDRARGDRANRDTARQVRAFDLFQAKAWLDMPATARPEPARIAAILGDCTPERALPDNDEAAVFCAILAARLLALEGRTAEAAAKMARVPTVSGDDAVTERWRLDLRRERRLE